MAAATHVLERRGLYILPTRSGWLSGAALVAMLAAAINYHNNLAFLLAFLLGAVVLVSMFYTHRNLLGLELYAGRAEPVFAGQTARVELWLRNPGRRPRLGVCVCLDRREVARADVPAGGETRVQVPVPARRRGRLPPVSVTLATDYPLGLLFSWSRRLDLRPRGLVYPAPRGERPLPAPEPDRRRYQSEGRQAEGDDFLGLRAYREGDPPRHIHWKAVARGQPPLTKEFGGAGRDRLWLDWERLAGPDPEARLSQLARWVVEADRAGLCYGLRLPGLELAPERGPHQARACLEALALY